jgi:CRP-like cAMP-binding protein
VGAKVGSHTVLYRRGELNSTFTLVLQGRACVWAGSESFLSEVAPWTCVGNNALLKADYRPDFTAVTAGACRLLQISR